MAIEYDPEAIVEIYRLTSGQPYLIQLICHNLVSRYNHQRLEEDRDPEPRFTLTDVQAIIDSPTFLREGSAYFSGIWSQASEQHGPTQQAILRALSHPHPTPTSLNDIQQHHPDTYTQALTLLEQNDILDRPDPDSSQYHYVVELMRRWVEATQFPCP